MKIKLTLSRFIPLLLLATCAAGRGAARSTEKKLNNPALSVSENYVCLTRGGKLLCWGKEPGLSFNDKVAKPQPPKQQLPAGKVAATVVAGLLGCVVMEGNLEVHCWGPYGNRDKKQKPVQKVTGIRGKVLELHADSVWYVVTTEGLFTWGVSFKGEAPVAKEVKGFPRDLVAWGGTQQNNVDEQDQLALDSKGRLHTFSVDPTTKLLKYAGEKPKFDKPVTYLARVSDDWCVLLKGGTARCWPVKPDAVPYTLVEEDGKTEVKNLRAVASFQGKICAATKDRRLACGDKFSLGTYGYPVKLKPVKEVAKEEVLTIAGSNATMCVHFKSRAVWCVGRGYEGQLGRGTPVAGVEPQPWGPVVF